MSIYIKEDDKSSLSFLFLGDWGWTGVNQSSVADQMSLWSSENDASFVIALGDNFYKDGVTSVKDDKWKSTFKKPYYHESLINIPWYAILGNHDYHSNPKAQIDYYYLNRNSQKVSFYYHYYYYYYQILLS